MPTSPDGILTVTFDPASAAVSILVDGSMWPSTVAEITVTRTALGQTSVPVRGLENLRVEGGWYIGTDHEAPLDTEVTYEVVGYDVFGDEVRAGRVNAMRNPSFELDMANLVFGASVSGLLSTNASAFFSGITGLRIAGTASPTTSTSTVQQVSAPASFKAGDIAQVTVRARQASAVTGVWMRLYAEWQDASGVAIGSATFGAYRLLTTPNNVDQPAYVLDMPVAPAGTDRLRTVMQFSGASTSATNPPASFLVHADAWFATPVRSYISVVGDSLVRGYTGSTAWSLAEAFPAFMPALLPGTTVTNRGWGGQTIDTVRFLWPSIDVRFTPAGGLIPASGPVACTPGTYLALGDNEPSTSGTLAGVAGTMAYTAAGGWTFTRTTPGAAVPVSGAVPFINDRPNERQNVAVLWAGRNDLNQGITGQESTTPEHVVASVARWVAEIDHDRFVVIPPMNQTVESVGTSGYNAVREIEARLVAAYGSKVLDIRSWFVNQAIYDLGLTPTSGDLAAIAGDAPPPQITDGGSHYTKPVAPLIAAKVAGKINALGYDSDRRGDYFDGDTPGAVWTGAAQASTSILPAATPATVTVSTTGAAWGLWLKAPGRADLTVLAQLKGRGDVSAPTIGGTFQVHDGVEVAAWSGVGGDRLTLQLQTRSTAQDAAVRSLLKQARVLLIQSGQPADFGDGTGSDWWYVENPSQTNPQGYVPSGDYALRYHTLQLVRTAAPAGDGVVYTGQTYSTVYAEFATYQALKDATPTYEDLMTGGA